MGTKKPKGKFYYFKEYDRQMDQQSKTGYPLYPPLSAPTSGYPEVQGVSSGYWPTSDGSYPFSTGCNPPPPHGDYPPAHVAYPPSHSGYPPSHGDYPPPQGVPITSQPLSQGGAPTGDWMSIPQHVTNCPPGLEYLTMIDQLLVHQKVELLEAFTGFETQNKYSIKNSLGQKIYYAGEDSDCCTRNCCGPSRPFDMKIIDNFGTEVINLHRPLACDSCCCPCCLQTIEVTAPPGTIVGTVEQQWSIFCPKFVIKNASGEVILRIDGPFCTQSCCCGDVEFQVMSADGNTQVGKITKQWSGIVKEMFTDADNFGVTFPMDLDVRMKAVMIGACFLIDFMFFERTREKSDNPGML